MGKRNRLVLISTFIIFVFEATLTFIVGKKSADPDGEWTTELLPSWMDMLKIALVVGLFSLINQVIVDKLQ
tara:strand:- start:1912 stop:2124 length:213 start_codon:yes stop_codon:yes gene_type:complete